jgi:hypothetical protein
MKNKELKLRKTRYVLSFLMIVILSVLVVHVDKHIIKEEASSESYYYEGPWEIQINEESYRTDLLKKFKFSPLKEGDFFVMSSIVPAINYEDAVMRLLVYHTTVEVYVEGELIYSYGLEK